MTIFFFIQFIEVFIPELIFQLLFHKRFTGQDPVWTLEDKKRMINFIRIKGLNLLSRSTTFSHVLKALHHTKWILNEEVLSRNLEEKSDFIMEIMNIPSEPRHPHRSL